jgi:hypothetical protein
VFSILLLSQHIMKPNWLSSGTDSPIRTLSNRDIEEAKRMIRKLNPKSSPSPRNLDRLFPGNNHTRVLSPRRQPQLGVSVELISAKPTVASDKIHAIYTRVYRRPTTAGPLDDNNGAPRWKHMLQTSGDAEILVEEAMSVPEGFIRVQKHDMSPRGATSRPQTGRENHALATPRETLRSSRGDSAISEHAPLMSRHGHASDRQREIPSSPYKNTLSSPRETSPCVRTARRLPQVEHVDPDMTVYGQSGMPRVRIARKGRAHYHHDDDYDEHEFVPEDSEEHLQMLIRGIIQRRNEIGQSLEDFPEFKPVFDCSMKDLQLRLDRYV